MISIYSLIKIHGKKELSSGLATFNLTLLTNLKLVSRFIIIIFFNNRDIYFLFNLVAKYEKSVQLFIHHEENKLENCVLSLKFGFFYTLIGKEKKKKDFLLINLAQKILSKLRYFLQK